MEGGFQKEQGVNMFGGKKLNNQFLWKNSEKQLSKLIILFGGSLLEWRELRDSVAPGKSRISQPLQNTQISRILHFSFSVDAKHPNISHFTFFIFS